MIVNEANLAHAFNGYKAVFNEAFAAGKAHWDQVAMVVPSSARDEAYGWLGQFPKLREWIGSRVVSDIQAHGFTIVNKKYESTLGIKRDDFADDRYGVFKPMFAEMGHQAKTHPDELLFALLKSGETATCYDGQYFFDTDHLGVDETGTAISVSNVDDPNGTAEPWYLLDCSRQIKPLIWQRREDYEFQFINRPTDTHVFMEDEYLYGVRARVNAGFGLWQMAYMGKTALDETSYGAARAAMMTLRGDQGRMLGLVPNVLVVPPSLEADARRVVMSDRGTQGGPAVWQGTAEVVVTPHVA
ncbi:MAG: Mu-like prophage major head subunit gpT family protein [Rhodobacteraceae bacterium]|nr:Mu-like prophage major head subunit gpT family protein [Paracoccaceae bacterium]